MSRSVGTCLVVSASLLVLVGSLRAQEGRMLATVKAAPDGLRWVSERTDADWILSVSGGSTRLEESFKAGSQPRLAVKDRRRGTLADGTYQWELRAVPRIDPELREKMAEVRAARDRGENAVLVELEKFASGPLEQSGTFSVAGGRVVNPTSTEAAPERANEGDLRVAGDLKVSGAKAFEVRVAGDDRRIVYVALEGPEAGTYYRGTAKTRGGVAAIQLPSHFAEVTEAEGLTVQLTPTGAWSQLFVAEVSPERLVVGDASGQDSAFSFLVQGVRKGYLDYSVEQPADADGN